MKGLYRTPELKIVNCESNVINHDVDFVVHAARDILDNLRECIQQTKNDKLRNKENKRPNRYR